MDILYTNGWFLSRAVAAIVFRMQVSGRRHVPHKGGFILASNHVSYFDPPLLGSAVNRELHFLAKAELFRNPVFGWILRNVNAIPVKRGAMDRQALKMAVAAIGKGYGLTLFPEGTRSKTADFLPPKPGLGMIASHAGCPIVPAYVDGSNDPAACLLGRTHLHIAFGEPFPAEWVCSFEASKQSYLEISSSVLERIGIIRADFRSRQQLVH